MQCSFMMHLGRFILSCHRRSMNYAYCVIRFKIDITSPGHAEGIDNGIQDVDYEILSKDPNRTANEKLNA